MKKFKHWLIKKLGGCLPETREVCVTKRLVTPITISVVDEINLDSFGEFQQHTVNEAVRNILARKIGEELLLHELVIVTKKYDEFTGLTRFTANVVVMSKKWSVEK